MTSEIPLRRLAFLDALRGLAALSVAVAHRGAGTIDGFIGFDVRVVRLGQFGVVLFFLCSGFIIPASMERYNSLRRFWLNRFFRLFPLYWAALALFFLLFFIGLYPLPDAYVEAPVLATLTNLTMLQAFFGQPLVIGLSWTLAYEMCFYIVMSLLFVARVEAKSMSIAAPAICLVAAIGLQNVGAPVLFVGVLLVGTLVLAARLLMISPTAWTRAALLATAGVGAFVLFHGHDEAWYAVILLTSMFIGTVLYRVSTGEVSHSRGLVLASVGAGVAVGSCVLNQDKPAVAVSVALAFSVFGLAFCQRHRRYPRWIVFLGTISYSTYLLHPLAYAIVGDHLRRPIAEQAAAFAVSIAMVLVLATLSYRFIEKPFVRIGHRVSARIHDSGRRFPAFASPVRKLVGTISQKP